MVLGIALQLIEEAYKVQIDWEIDAMQDIVA
jgi:hypothetical protein